MPSRERSAGSEFQLVLSPKRRAAARARRAIRRRFSAVLAEPVLVDLVAIVSELVNNSVQHGPGKPITVTLALGRESIRGEVADQGNPSASIPEISRAVESSALGLNLVDKLTGDWAVYEGSTHVWFEVPRDP